MLLLYIMNTDLPFLGQLASQGLLGVLLALSLFANWYFIRSIQSLNDKRVEDAKEMTSKILEPISTIQRNTELAISLFQEFLKRNGN